MIASIKNRLARILKGRRENVFRKLERRNRIDDHSAVFRIARDNWRYIENDQCTDFYMEEAAADFFLDYASFRFWSRNRYTPFSPQALVDPPTKDQVVNEEDKTRIVGKLGTYFRQRYNRLLIVQRRGVHESG